MTAFGPRPAQRKYAFEDGDVVQLSDGSVGIYSGDDWLSSSKDGER